MPVLAENGGGSIVITSSTAGIRATPGLSPLYNQQARCYWIDACRCHGRSQG